MITSKAENCYFDSTTALSFGGFSTFTCDAQLVDCEYGPNNTQLWYSDGNDAAMSLYTSGQINSAKYNFGGIGGSNWLYRSDMTVFGSQTNPNTPLVNGVSGDTYKLQNQQIYTAGSNVFWVGSRTAASPFFEWVPVRRD